MVSSRRLAVQITFFCGAFWIANTAFPQADDTRTLKALLRDADGGVARLKTRNVYHVREKIQLCNLCPHGVIIEGNDATLKALDGFRHNVLLTSTELLRNDPYAAGVTIRNLSLDGSDHVGRCVFGNWKHAMLDNLRVRGGTVYQVNAIWQNTTLSNLHVDGNAAQTNNGFDCSLQDSTMQNVVVNMHGNLRESAFWLNGCKNATVINALLIDGRTAFGLENCQDVNVINLKARGQYSFRVVNILPAKASERIHLYDIDLEPVHVGQDPSAGVHFNATRGGMVVRGTVRSAGPGVLLTNGASDISLIDVALPAQPVYPLSDWVRKGGNRWLSRRRDQRGMLINRPPVVFAGPDLEVQNSKDVQLHATVADELTEDQLKLAWQKKGGPGNVTFQDVHDARTAVTFSKPGRYALVFAASDGEFRCADEVSVTVGTKGSRRRPSHF